MHAHTDTFANLDQAHDNNENKSEQFPDGEEILDACGPANTGAVHPRQQHWERERYWKRKDSYFSKNSPHIDMNLLFSTNKYMDKIKYNTHTHSSK